MPSGIYKRIKPSHRKGVKHTEESRKKITESLKSFMEKNGVSKETRKKLSIANMGHIVTKETREKISKGNMGKKMSIDFINKCRLNNLGKKQSPESIAKRVSKNTGQKRSIEVRLKMSELKKGSKSPFWKGGITKVHLAIRTSIKYKLWREQVFKRDNWTCQECKQRGGKLNADHSPITFSAILNDLIIEQGLENLFEKALKYEMFWIVGNGKTLCEECHKKTPTFARNYKLTKK